VPWRCAAVSKPHSCCRSKYGEPTYLFANILDTDPQAFVAVTLNKRECTCYCTPSLKLSLVRACMHGCMPWCMHAWHANRLPQSSCHESSCPASPAIQPATAFSVLCGTPQQLKSVSHNVKLAMAHSIYSCYWCLSGTASGTAAPLLRGVFRRVHAKHQ
jgi:hypothetical protein